MDACTGKNISTRVKPCPVVACFGVDPLLHMIATRPEPYGRSEFDAVGGIKGEPVEVIRGEFTGLPIPAYAEIAIEGEFLPDQGKEEGPFSEWTGYYASGEKFEPLIKVHRLYHRNDPIITASPEYRPTARAEHCYELLRAAYIRDQVEKAGVPDVQAVASYFRRFLTVISIRQRYPGHARQAALIASQCQGAAYLGRYVVVVDDDIDAYDINDVLWAMCSRADPVDSAEILRRCWSGPLDPIIPRERKGFSSRMIIDACRPFEWRDKFPPAAEISAERQQAIIEKVAKQSCSADADAPVVEKKPARKARGPSYGLEPRYLPKLYCPDVVKDSLNAIIKEAGLFRVRPLATERDGGLSGGRCPVGAVLKEAARDAAF